MDGNTPSLKKYLVSASMKTKRDITRRYRAEEALRESEENYRRLFEWMGEAVQICELIFDENGRAIDNIILDVNPAYVQQSGGLQRSHVVGCRIKDILPHVEQAWLDRYADVVQAGRPIHFEEYSAALEKWFDVYASPMGGNRFSAVFSDITERKRSERELRESEERQAYLLCLSDALREVEDPREIQRIACKLIKEKLGTEQSSYTECHDDKGYYVVRTEDAEETGPKVNGIYMEKDYPVGIGILRSGAFLVVDDTLSTHLIPANEANKWLDYNIGSQISVPLIKNGMLVATFAVKQSSPRAWTPFDVSLVRETAERTWSAVERAKAEEALRESETILRTVLENSREAINMIDLASDKYVYMNEAHLDMMGLTAEEVKCISTEEAYDHIHPEDREIPMRQQKFIAAGQEEMQDAEYRWKVANGEYHYLSDRRKLVMDAQGRPAALVGIIRDITDQRKYEEMINFQAQILSNMHDAIFAIDKNFSITYWNDMAARLLGWTADEVIGKHSGKLLKTRIPGSSRESGIERLLTENYYEGETIHLHKDGSEVHVDIHVSVIRGSDGEIKTIIGSLRDITERKRMEVALRESEERQEFLLRLNDTLRRLSNPQSIQITASRILAEHLKVSQANYAEYHDDSTIWEGLSGINTSDKEVHNTGYFSSFLNILRDGTDLIIPDVSILSGFPEDQITQLANLGYRAHLSVPLIKDNELVATLTVRQVAPSEWKQQDISLLHETAERTWAAVERARAEKALKASETQARQLAMELDKKNRLVTDFFINISHEFKTPLTVLMLGLELLEAKAKKINEGHAFTGNLEAMKQNSYRLNRLVANLLDITKLDAGFMQPKWEEVEIAGLLRNLTQSVQPYAMQKQLSLEYICDAIEIPFTSDSSMLERISVNLLSNAIKHTTMGGHIKLICHSSNKGVSITVADNGEGIPDNKKAIIFDRFSQVDTRMTRASEGSGIGLALTRSLVELLGGKISVESTPGVGSTFTVELPVVKIELLAGTIEQGIMNIDKRVQMELSDIILS